MSGTEHPSAPLAAVIGWPIRHSRSPRIHGHWLARYGLPGHYVPVAIAPDRVEAGLAALAELGFAGCNVTIPHKEAALALAARRTPTAEAIGAANTLTFLPGGGFEADNTDAHGFITSLRAGAPGWDGPAGPALVLGAGGAARAILAGFSRRRSRRSGWPTVPRHAPANWPVILGRGCASYPGRALPRRRRARRSS